MSRKKLDKPKLWIVAGPNGSGKSSIYTDTDIEDFGGSVWIINPDLLTARIREIEHLKPRAANIAAVTRIYSWLEASIAAHQTIGVETVLSTEKYRALVLAAKAHGFDSDAWTNARLRSLIETQFGVRYSRVYIWQIATNLGLGHLLSKSRR